MKAHLKAVNGTGPAANVSRLGAWLAAQVERTGYSTRQIEELSGGLVSRSMVSALMTGRHRGLRLSPDVADGLARVFGVKPAAVREMAGSQVGEPYLAPDYARYLTPAQRRAVDAVIRAFIETD